ncbi:MAG: ABC transporter ATP-binding protein [Nitrospirae bacterium]|nr:ABC transporter ATP-binding protein [Nitrospirota bacterium]MBI3594303.1 ABC transporter ATP-binding protein [Nitrospirota bacterium]
MLKVENLRGGYGAIEVLKGIDLEVAEGETVSIIGANGAGKSTALMMISGILPYQSGKILFNGKEISGFSPSKIVSLGILQVPEGRRIFSRLTVLENLELGGFALNRKNASKNQFEYVFALFPLLFERKNQLGGTLSGGEQQMLAIGRALVGQPKLLIIDEPSLGLAPLMVEKIFKMIKMLGAEGLTLLLVEQNARLALSISQRAYVMETGQVTLQGESAQLLNDPRIKTAYLGE